MYALWSFILPDNKLMIIINDYHCSNCTIMWLFSYLLPMIANDLFFVSLFWANFCFVRVAVPIYHFSQ